MKLSKSINIKIIPIVISVPIFNLSFIPLIKYNT